MEPAENGERFANDYDNILYEKTQFTVLKSGKFDFTIQFPTLKDARRVSDHVPVYVNIE